MGTHSKGLVTGIMKFLITVAALFAIAECRRHLCDDGTRPICNDGSKAVYNRPTGKNTDGSKYFPPAVTMRRNAQLVRAREQWTSLLLHVLMAQSVSVQEVEKTANSTTEYVATDKDAGKCAARDNHTALGGPRTGTSTMVSGSSTLGFKTWQQG